jgi:hypothetical protein
MWSKKVPWYSDTQAIFYAPKQSVTLQTRVDEGRVGHRPDRLW